MEYKDLRQIDVSKYTEKKNGLTYLSWAWAVDQLLLADPKAHWFYPEFQRWGNGTVMVFCTVVANDIARTAQLPVMDYRNKPIAEPDSFAVNTAMQRALAKAIALHGIGLYIYNGEDLPPDTVEEVTIQTPKVSSNPPKIPNIPVPAKAVAALKTSQAWEFIPQGEQGSPEWIEGAKIGINSLLQAATTPLDVDNLFKVNRVVFDILKEKDKDLHSDLISKISTTKKALAKE